VRTAQQADTTTARVTEIRTLVDLSSRRGPLRPAHTRSSRGTMHAVLEKDALRRWCYAQMCYCASRLLVLAATALSHLVRLEYPLLSCDAVEQTLKGFCSPQTPSLPLELLPLILSSFSSDAIDAREVYVERTTFYGACALVHRTWTHIARRLRAEELFVSRTSDPLLRFALSKPPDVSALRILVVDSSFPQNSIVAADLCPLFAVCPNLVSLSLIDIRHLELGSLSCLTSLILDPEALPSLEAVELWDCELGWSFFPPGSHTTRTFPNITSLSCDISAWPLLHLQQLDLPNLNLLNISHRTLGDLINPELIARYLPNGGRLPFPIKHLRIEWTDPAMLSHRLDNPLPYDLALISDCACIIQNSRREPLFKGLESITIPPLTASYAHTHFRHYYTELGVPVAHYGEDEIERSSRREANSAWFRSGFWREVERRSKV
ncbi:Proteophosphoglycan ppg1, partial [Rhodotorula toruloides]